MVDNHSNGVGRWNNAIFIISPILQNDNVFMFNFLKTTFAATHTQANVWEDDGGVAYTSLQTFANNWGARV